MAFSPKITLVAALLLLTACRSDPIHFHTLTLVQPARGSGDEIKIEGLSVPPQVDRPQIVIRQGNSGLAILETDWWGASLADELRSALVDQLSNVNTQHKVSLLLDVQRFDSIPGHYGLIDVKWRLRPLVVDDSTLFTCRSTLQTPSGPTINDLVAAQQKNVKRLAAVISHAAAEQRGCPASL